MDLRQVLENDAKRPRLTKKERQAIRSAIAELERLRQENKSLKTDRRYYAN